MMERKKIRFDSLCYFTSMKALSATGYFIMIKYLNLLMHYASFYVIQNILKTFSSIKKFLICICQPHRFRIYCHSFK